MSISRIEQSEKDHFGYYVRVTRDGIQYSKFFADKKYGGKNGAMAAAVELDTALREELPLQSQAGRKTIRNTSGHVGVSRTKSTRKGHTYEYWQACWGSGESRKSTKFSIKKYGTRQAKRLAIEARKAWEQEALEENN